MSSLISSSTGNIASLTLQMSLAHDQTYDGSSADSSDLFALDDHVSTQKTEVVPSFPLPSVVGRSIETGSTRRLSGSTFKHKRKEEKIQKHLAHRKRSSSEPPPLERPESDTSNTRSASSSGKPLTTSQFFNRLSHVKNLQRELREQHQTPLSTHSLAPSLAPTMTETTSLESRSRSNPTSSINTDSNTGHPSTQPGKEDNRNIRMNIIQKRYGSLPKGSPGVKEGRYHVSKETSKTKNEKLSPSMSIPLAKLKEHRRRKLGIVCQVTEMDRRKKNSDCSKGNGMWNPDEEHRASVSQTSESLGSFVTESMPSGESEMDGIAYKMVLESKLGKYATDQYFGNYGRDLDYASQYEVDVGSITNEISESLGSLVTELTPSNESDMDGFLCRFTSDMNLRKDAVVGNSNNSMIDRDCTSQFEDYLASVSHQISESLGSLVSESTPLTENESDRIVCNTASESEQGISADYLILGSHMTDPDYASHSEKIETTTAYRATMGESCTETTTSQLNGSTTTYENSNVESNASQKPQDNEFIPFEMIEPTENTISIETPLVLSDQNCGKSFDFRQIEAIEKPFVDPSWDAHRVYFNEFDNGKKSVGDEVDFFGNENDNWVSLSPQVFSANIRPYTGEYTPASENISQLLEQVEEEKKERDTLSVDRGFIVNDFNVEASNVASSEWTALNQSALYTVIPTSVAAYSDLESGSERESEAENANLLHNSASMNESSLAISDSRQKKEERIEEYNTFEVDEESSTDESECEPSEEEPAPEYIHQLNSETDDDISMASKQSDVFDFTPQNLAQLESNEKPIAGTPLSDVPAFGFDLVEDKGGCTHLPWDEVEQSQLVQSEREAVPGAPERPFVPPPPPPPPRVSSPRRSRSFSKTSSSMLLIDPPPPEKLLRWEQEKARPLEHLKKFNSMKVLQPPPPPPPPPQPLPHRGRRSREVAPETMTLSGRKQSVEYNNDYALSSNVASNRSMTQKVESKICSVQQKCNAQSVPLHELNSTEINGQNPSSNSGLTNDSNCFDPAYLTLTTNDGNGEETDEVHQFRDRNQTDSSQHKIHPDGESSPFCEAIGKMPVLISRILEFLGDPVAVCRVKMLNSVCKKYVEENEHRLMRDAVRLGGISMLVRPTFWLWVTLEKSNDIHNERCGMNIQELEKHGREGKWHSVIERDVARAFGNLPPHKSGARLRTDSIVRALVSWGRGRMIKKGVKGDGEAPPLLSTSKSNDSDVTPTDTVSDWGAVAPASSTLSELDESVRWKNNDIIRNSGDNKGELALSGSVLPDELKADLRGKLSFILHSLAASNPDVGYCQGMDYVVAHLLRILQETIRWKAAFGNLPSIIKSAPTPLDSQKYSQESLLEQYTKIDKSVVVEDTLFHVMESFFGSYNLRHFYYPELRCLKTCCRVFERLIQLKLPVLADHFEHHELNVGLFALGWFQTLFLYLPSMPSATVCHMWDIWLVERSFKIFFRVGTAILFLSQPTLLNHELEGMMSYLNTFPDATLLSPDILIACALQIKVTNKLLMRLEREVIYGNNNA